MSDETSLLRLPYIMPSQAQKPITHNDALRVLDAIIHLKVEDRDRNDPPESPVDGQRYALGASPTGSFAGQAGKIAAFQDGAWEYFSPQPGWTIWDAEDEALLVFHEGGWLPVAPEPETLPKLGINTTADSTNRLAASAPATLLTHAGEGHQLKINKAAAGNTASMLFQTDWSGRAELGLAGNDDLSVKVSADGSAWTTAVQVAAASGNVGLGTGAPVGVLEARRDQAYPGITRIAVNNPNATGLAAFSLYGGPGNVERGRMQYNHSPQNVYFGTIGAVPFYIGTSDTVRVVVTSGGAVNFTSGLVNPHASAKLQVDSTTQGFLPPRLTSVQRDAIATPAEGLVIYSTTDHEPQFWDGSAWVPLG